MVAGVCPRRHVDCSRRSWCRCQLLTVLGVELLHVLGLHAAAIQKVPFRVPINGGPAVIDLLERAVDFIN